MAMEKTTDTKKSISQTPGQGPIGTAFQSQNDKYRKSIQ
jgi:hypothetical protein